MARSLIIAAYLAKLGGGERREKLATQPPRPPGWVVWARCSHVEQLTAIEMLGRKLSEDGDPIHIVTTLQDWAPEHTPRALPEPKGQDSIRAFLAHWQPRMGVWVRGDLDPVLLSEMRNADVSMILVDATGDRLEQVAGAWMPGSIRNLLGQFEAILALDHQAAERLRRSGAPEETLLVAGAMEDCAPTLPCDDATRNDIARAIGTRPVWLAAAATRDEISDICAAHSQAARRTHRLLLVVYPQDPAQGGTYAEDIAKLGFHVARRSAEPLPEDVTQIYVIDTPDDLGLWYRVAPISYLGGSLRGGGCRDPFEPAALGSVVIYGPQIAPYRRHAARLNAAGASVLLRSAGDLGPAVEDLLAPDKAASMAHAAWDVSSRGAYVTNRIAAFIKTRLEELEA